NTATAAWAARAGPSRDFSRSAWDPPRGAVALVGASAAGPECVLPLRLHPEGWPSRSSHGIRAGGDAPQGHGVSAAGYGTRHNFSAEDLDDDAAPPFTSLDLIGGRRDGRGGSGRPGVVSGEAAIRRRARLRRGRGTAELRRPPGGDVRDAPP